MTLPKDKLEILYNADFPPIINIGSGAELKIDELVEIIVDVVGFEGVVRWDKSKPLGSIVILNNHVGGGSGR